MACPRCRSGFLCPEHGGPEIPSDQLWITGRDRFLMEKLGALLQKAAEGGRHAVTEQRDEQRGVSFDVQVHVAGEPAGHIARVTVVLDRLET